MNSYKTSLGERVTSSTIKRNVSRAKDLKLKQFFKEHGYHYCEDCGVNAQNSFKLDCSHVIPVKKCLESGQTEKAWDISNIKLLCRKCHKTKDRI